MGDAFYYYRGVPLNFNHIQFLFETICLLHLTQTPKILINNATQTHLTLIIFKTAYFIRKHQPVSNHYRETTADKNQL